MYLLKVSLKIMSTICLKLTIIHRHYVKDDIKFEQISRIALKFLLLTLNKQTHLLNCYIKCTVQIDFYFFKLEHFFFFFFCYLFLAFILLFDSMLPAAFSLDYFQCELLTVPLVVTLLSKIWL